MCTTYRECSGSKYFFVESITARAAQRAKHCFCLDTCFLDFKLSFSYRVFDMKVFFSRYQYIVTNRNTSQLVTCIGQNSGCKYFFVEKITVQHSVLLKLFVCLDIKLSFSYRVLNVGVIQNFKFQNSELRRKNHFLQVQNSKSKGITTLPIHILTKIDKRHNFEW